MTEHKIPIQSLIDHIKTAIDVDDWAKNMVEDLLKKQEPVEPTINEYGEAYCSCGEMVGIISNYDDVSSVRMNYCPECGKEMIWSDVEKKKRTRNWYN